MKLKKLNCFLPSAEKDVEQKRSRHQQGINRQPQNSYYGEDSFDFLRLITSWPTIVGDENAKHSIPLKLCNRTLTILTDHSVFSQNLSFFRNTIIHKTEEAFPSLKNQISNLNFQVNPSFFTKQSMAFHAIQKKRVFDEQGSKPHRYSPLYHARNKEIQEWLKHIDEEEIKQIFTSLFLQNLKQ